MPLRTIVLFFGYFLFVPLFSVFLFLRCKQGTSSGGLPYHTPPRGPTNTIATEHYLRVSLLPCSLSVSGSLGGGVASATLRAWDLKN